MCEEMNTVKNKLNRDYFNTFITMVLFLNLMQMYF